MYCLKCGRDTPGEQVFCEACLEGMKQFPVKPGTAVTLPSRRNDSEIKKQQSRKRPVSPEEQVLLLRKRLRRSRIALLILILLLGVAAAVLAQAYLAEGWRIAAAPDNRSAFIQRF